jgi:hypothetical protein
VYNVDPLVNGLELEISDEIPYRYSKETAGLIDAVSFTVSLRDENSKNTKSYEMQVVPCPM